MREDESQQEGPAPFVIEYVPAETTVGFTGSSAAPTPFIIEVPAREPYQDSKIPWTYEGSVGNFEQQFSVMGVTPSGRVYTNPKIAGKGKAPAASGSPAYPAEEGGRRRNRGFHESDQGERVPKETAPDRIEETVSSIFSNVISFSDDELPSEGWAHSRALHIVCKYNNFVIGRVMIDNGSAFNVCLVSTLKQMNVDLNRVRPSKTAVRAFDGSRREPAPRKTLDPLSWSRSLVLAPKDQGHRGGSAHYGQGRGLGFRPSCHEIIEARRGKHLHRLAALYGKVNRGILVPPLSHFFPAPPHVVGGTLDGPFSALEDEPVDLSAICAVTEETPLGGPYSSRIGE
ncbi:hypothetical protein CRG98_022597 [Punica granatum]|uniref:Uncharacterized protein n=1 Tax=Punica granatum TaxID=22663 RepID=A0A2I0JMD5_PUNGR|nr:hypothetical protein CRG98_022597 [Punica granatum]